MGKWIRERYGPANAEIGSIVRRVESFDPPSTPAMEIRVVPLSSLITQPDSFHSFVPWKTSTRRQVTKPKSGNYLMYWMASRAIWRIHATEAKGLDATFAYDWSQADINRNKLTAVNGSAEQLCFQLMEPRLPRPPNRGTADRASVRPMQQFTSCRGFFRYPRNIRKLFLDLGLNAEHRFVCT